MRIVGLVTGQEGVMLHARRPKKYYATQIPRCDEHKRRCGSRRSLNQQHTTVGRSGGPRRDLVSRASQLNYPYSTGRKVSPMMLLAYIK